MTVLRPIGQQAEWLQALLNVKINLSFEMVVWKLHLTKREVS